MEYVYAAFSGNVLHGPTGSVEMWTGDVWYADDPFVLARPDLFSSTPLTVRSTNGRTESPDATALPTKRKAAKARG